MPTEVRQAYPSAAKSPDIIRGICADFRASATVDCGHDRNDRDQGRRLTSPTLAVWAESSSMVDPGTVWSNWAADLRTLVMSGGHFLPESRAAELNRAILDLMGLPTSD